jgi:hypothetical protein
MVGAFSVLATSVARLSRYDALLVAGSGHAYLGYEEASQCRMGTGAISCLVPRQELKSSRHPDQLLRVLSALLDVCLTDEAAPFQPFGFDKGPKF